MAKNTTSHTVNFSNENRDDAVTAKGKGTMQTYWLVMRTADTRSVISSSNTSLASDTNSSLEAWEGFRFKSEEFRTKDVTMEDSQQGLFALPPSSRNAKSSRLVDWLADLIAFDIKRLHCSRQKTSITNSLPENFPELIDRKGMVLDEVVEAFSMPKFDPKAIKHNDEFDQVQLPSIVMEQLRELVKELSETYRPNPFHNFEHASHVTMASVKLLKRIVTPEDVDYNKVNVDAVADELHKYTFGITSDAMIHLAVTFSALIHDADHSGVPNFQVAKERPELAKRYKNESILEQNSVDVAWDIFIQPKYKDLHKSIFTSTDDMRRFRQYVVNFVSATGKFPALAN